MREIEHDGVIFRVLKIILVESDANEPAKSTMNYDNLENSFRSSEGNQLTEYTRTVKYHDHDESYSTRLSHILDMYTAHSLPHQKIYLLTVEQVIETVF